jgi:glycosyltransferase involved in cell wall biosynthesis
MRIFQAIDCYPPPLVGGHALHVRMLAHELVRRGHDVEVVTLAGPGGARTEMDGDVAVHRIAGWSRALDQFSADPERPFHPPIPDPGMVHSLIDLMRERRPDVVHAHGWILHSLLPFLPSRQTRLVVTMHEYGLICPKFTFVHGSEICDGPRFAKCVACASGQYGAIRATAITTGLTMTRRLRHRVDRYIAVSTTVAQACASLSGGGQRGIEVIPPFLSDSSFQQVNCLRPAFVPADSDYLMFAGALGPHKGIDVLLEAWRGLDPAIPLVLAGLRRHDTPHRFPEGVIVAEDVPHSDVLRAWAHCTVAVVPSRWPDPCPLVALEAMAAGRPVIASSVGGLPDLVRDGITGILVPPGDVQALRASIAQLLRDPEQRSRMGEAGRQRAADYSANALVPQIERVYREVTASPPPPAIAKGRHEFRYE